jgi:hypothetical protein
MIRPILQLLLRCVDLQQSSSSLSLPTLQKMWDILAASSDTWESLKFISLHACIYLDGINFLASGFFQ